MELIKFTGINIFPEDKPGGTETRQNILIYRLLVFNIISCVFCKLKRAVIISVVRHFKLQNCVHSVMTQGGNVFGISCFRINAVLYVRRKRSGRTRDPNFCSYALLMFLGRNQ